MLVASLAQQARIVLLADEGVGANEIVQRVEMFKPTLVAWKKRDAAEGIAGVEDRAKPGRQAQRDEVAVVPATLEPPPEKLRVTHFERGVLADHLGGISNVWVARIWRKWGLQYELFFDEGETRTASRQDYTLENTERLLVDQTKELLLTIPELAAQLERNIA